MTEVQTDQDLSTPMRWTVRILALLAAALFVFFAIYLGARVFPTLSSGPQGIPLLIVMGIALLGFLVAWRWEVVGGIITVAGATGIVALVCLVSGIDMLLCAFLFSLPLYVAGALYLGCCWRTRGLGFAQES